MREMMRNPDRLNGTEEQSLSAQRLSTEARQQVRRAAFLRPTSLLVVAIGGVFFALTLTWWSIPLTIATYAVLVFLAARSAPSLDSVLEGRENRPGTRPEATEARHVSPERRARWLPRGETRQKVEAALEVKRRTVIALQESGDIVQAVLDDAVPKLEGVAERLVDVAHTREKVAGAIHDLEARPSTPRREEGRDSDLTELENELHAADTEISSTFEKLLALRARVVRVSVESGGAAQEAAAKVNADLDEMNLRLDALQELIEVPPGLTDH
jgi:ribosome-associated translation inhibitor RaiA